MPVKKCLVMPKWRRKKHRRRGFKRGGFVFTVSALLAAGIAAGKATALGGKGAAGRIAVEETIKAIKRANAKTAIR